MKRRLQQMTPLRSMTGQTPFHQGTQRQSSALQMGGLQPQRRRTTVPVSRMAEAAPLCTVKVPGEARLHLHYTLQGVVWRCPCTARACIMRVRCGIFKGAPPPPLPCSEMTEDYQPALPASVLVTWASLQLHFLDKSQIT